MTNVPTEQTHPHGTAFGTTRICMTEWHGFSNSSESDIRQRFDYYEKLGIDTIRLGDNWLRKRPMVNALKASSFRIKLILSVVWLPHDYKEKHPEGLTIDEKGRPDKHLGPWSPGFSETTRRVGSERLEMVRRIGLADRVDEVVVDLGPACEGIYPANWTLQREGEQTYWCYSELAQADFRAAMRAKYPTIEDANNAWDLTGSQRFKHEKEIHIPKPRTAWAKGPFWNDMLLWYRDSKRRMILDRIKQTQELTRKYLGANVKCIVYLPGHAYSQGDWDRAVREASGPPSIRLMMDNDWLMKVAIEEGCILQYTGVENVKEVRNIVQKLKAMGSDAYKSMWGENAGLERVGHHPLQLANVITENGLRGVDFTWCKWLFEKDGITPNGTFTEFEQTVRKIQQFYGTPKRRTL